MSDEKQITVVGDVSRDISPTSSQVVVKDDPAAPSAEVSSKKQSLSDIFTIVCSADQAYQFWFVTDFRSSVPELHSSPMDTRTTS